MTQHRPSHRSVLFLAALAVAAIPLSAVIAQDRGASFTVVETGQGFARLQDAVSAIGTAKGTIRIAPGRYRQCAVQTGGVVTYIAAEAGSVVFDGVTCEGKAALVLRGEGARVSGIIFQNMRVPDKNGAGIRLEQGNLGVTESWFRDSEQGILTGGEPPMVLSVDRSTFTRLGTCEGVGGCAHSIYTGTLGRVGITNSRFEEGAGGHYVKSRAQMVDISGNSFDDAKGNETNYMIDLPAGSRGRIAGNWFVQGASKENYSAFIAVGAEDVYYSSEGLDISQNVARFAPGVDRTSTFVANWTDDRIALGENRLASGLKPYEDR